MFLQSKKRRAIACAGIIVVSEYLRKKRVRRKWAKNWLLRRNDFSHMSLLRELRAADPNDFHNYLRMDENTFNILLNLVGQHLQQKQNKVMRQAIPAKERLISTLRFLATGRSYEDLKYSTCIAAQTLGQLIPETCRVIYNVLKEKYMKFPTTKQEWIEIAQGFKNRWQMINCGGALDGRHIRIERPALSGAQYYNYTNFYSVVLMALVNSNYEFVYVDVGKQGRLSDGVISSTKFYDMLVNDERQFPNNDENDEKLNFVIVGDELLLYMNTF